MSAISLRLQPHHERHVHSASTAISLRQPCLHLGLQLLLDHLCMDAFRTMKASVILHADITRKREPKSIFAWEMLWKSASWRRRRISVDICGVSRRSVSKHTGILCLIRLHLQCYIKDHVSKCKSQVWGTCPKHTKLCSKALWSTSEDMSLKKYQWSALEPMKKSIYYKWCYVWLNMINGLY